MVSDGFFPHHNSSVHTSSDPERNAPGRHSGLNKPKLISPSGRPHIRSSACEKSAGIRPFHGTAGLK